MLRTPFSGIRRRLGGSFRMNVVATMNNNTSQSARVLPSVPNIDYRNECVEPNSLMLRIQGVARIHTAARPLIIMVGTVSPHFMAHRPSEVATLLLSKRCIQKRMMSSNNNKNTEASGDKKTESAEQSPAAAETEEPGRLSSIVRSVGPTLRKVTEINVGDLVSVYAIIILIALIIFSPYVIA